MAEAEARKIATHHLEREACLYVRQSSLRQVMRNTESTRRQLLFRTLYDDGFPGLFDASGARISKIIRSLPERRTGAHSV